MTRARHAQHRRSPGRAATTARPGRHRRPSARRQRAVALAVVPLVLATGTAAYAFWSATATGSASVTSTSATPLTVSAAASAPPALYPGRQVDVGFTVSNPNVYPVSLTTLTGVSLVSSDETACPAGTHLELPAAVTTGVAGAGYALPAPVALAASSSAQGSLAGLITMRTTAPDGCQGKSFTVTLSFIGSQV